jgi:uncharacterized membrane protein
METIALLGSIMGLGFVAGIRLYATVLTVGLGIRFGWIHLDPNLASLTILTHPYILTVAGFFYVVEFFADKIPWVDSLWDSIHTLIRPIAAAFLGATALGSVDPVIKITAFLICGGVAFSSHSTKAGTRLIVNHSPEPFTNIALSLFEDIFAIFGVWLSLRHPIAVFCFVLVFLALFVWLFPKFLSLAKRQALTIYRWVKNLFGSREQISAPAITPIK